MSGLKEASSLSHRELFKLNGTLSNARIEQLIDEREEFEEAYNDAERELTALKTDKSDAADDAATALEDAEEALRSIAWRLERAAALLVIGDEDSMPQALDLIQRALEISKE